MGVNRIAVTASLVGLATSCGTGLVRFQELDPQAETIRQTPTQAYTIDCQDFESGTPHSPFPENGKEVVVMLAGFPPLFPLLMPVILVAPPPPHPPLAYVVTCTKDGGAIPWKVLGAYQAWPAAFDRWDQYSRVVVAKAGDRGCPAVLLRRTPPTRGKQGREALGALCVDPEQPSGIGGALRLVSLGTSPLQLLRDGDPSPIDLPGTP